MAKNNSKIMVTKMQFPIRKEWLMFILLTVPAVAIFGAWDVMFNEQQLRPYLQFTALALPVYLLIFELPHIIASFLSFGNQHYVQHYRWHLGVGLPALLVGFLLLSWLSVSAAIILYLVATLFHVIRQQVGIAHFFGVPRNYWHACWTWSMILGLAAMYIIAQPMVATTNVQAELFLAVHCVIILSGLLGFALILQTKSFIGSVYVLATIAMTIVSYAMFMLGYDFLSVLVVRIIHDVTAFIFYITHEMNSNADEVKNWLYRLLPFMPWSLVVVVPLLAIAAGLTIRSLAIQPTTLFVFIMVLSFMHYYLESIIWKRDGLHRDNIHIM